MNEDKIKIINEKNSVKTLGICVRPSLRCNDEFEYMKQKMKDSIKS